ncbi:unnamed protein product [Orchesella dallaii]|uniref:Calnexin n=1 Tax=Orchesella dallaii TaxID=48710 RepID=A0ABP1PMX5_9HEXA
MGPRKFVHPALPGILLFLLTFSSIVQSHSNQESQKVDDNDLNDDVEGVSMKLDDYEIEYKTPVPSESVHFYETFDDTDEAKKRWIVSRAQKEDNENVFKYEGRWEFDLPERRIFPNDRALVLHSKAKHAAISAKLDRKFEFNQKPLIVQYEVTFQNGMDCGGAYIKLLSDTKDMKLDEFHDRTPYTIMFGPDKCGSDIKLHFIFRHKNPLNGTFEEKHSKRPSNRVEDAFNDKKPHLYRLVLKPTNRFEVFVDGLLINQGSLLEDMEPPVNPPIEVEDPNDKKPADWDERERIPDDNSGKPVDWDEDAPPKIPDPSAQTPSGWLEDEPEMIPDPGATMPEDWDESMDGSWEAPLIPNPKCEDAIGCGPWTAPLIENPNFRGKWQPPMIDNPNFKGKWSRRKIPNPDYFEDKEPFKMAPIGAVGLEIWTMTDLVLFDNFIVSDKEAIVNEFTENTFNLKTRALERDSRGVIDRIINYSNSHPWLYAVYTIVIGLPVVLIIAFCCGGSQDKKSDPAASTEQDEDADENDQPTRGPPVRENLQRSKHTVTQAAAERTVNNSRVGMSKDDLEQEQPEEEDAEEEGDVEVIDNVEDTDDQETGEVANEQSDESEENSEEVEEIPAEEDEVVLPEPEDPQAAAGLKKRRIRRD